MDIKNTCLCMHLCVCVFECLCVTCANEYTKGSPKKPCFLVLLFSSSTDSLLTGFIPSYPGESRFSDPWRQCREGPLKAAPTQMGRWTLAANEKRTQHLTHTGWNFTSVLELPLSGYLGGTDIGVSLCKKKTGHGEPGETPCLLPCATKGCFAAPNTLLCSRAPP